MLQLLAALLLARTDDCPSGWTSGKGGLCFHATVELRNQAGCVELCGALNAVVACIATIDEAAAALEAIGGGGSDRMLYAWIGRYMWPLDAAVNDPASWAHCASGGAPTGGNFTNWADNQPRGISADGYRGYCAAMDTDGRWADLACSGNPRRCVCQRQRSDVLGDSKMQEATTKSLAADRLAALEAAEDATRWAAWLPGLICVVLVASIPPGLILFYYLATHTRGGRRFALSKRGSAYSHCASRRVTATTPFEMRRVRLTALDSAGSPRATGRVHGRIGIGYVAM